MQKSAVALTLENDIDCTHNMIILIMDGLVANFKHESNVINAAASQPANCCGKQEKWGNLASYTR